MIHLLLGCENDVQYVEAGRILDSFSYVDAGIIAVEDRRVFTVPLCSRGNGPVDSSQAVARVSYGQS